MFENHTFQQVKPICSKLFLNFLVDKRKKSLSLHRNLSNEQGEREEQRYSASLSKPETNKGNSAGIA